MFIWESLSWSLVLLFLIEFLHPVASSLFLPLGYFSGLWVVLTVVLLYRSPENIKLVLSGRLLILLFLIMLGLFAWRFTAVSLQ